MSPVDQKKAAKAAVKGILADLIAREGLREVWGKISNVNKSQIRKRWEEITTKAFEPDVPKVVVKKPELFVVRVYDGFDHCWCDVSGPVSQEEAQKIWNGKTNNGTKAVSFSDIDYYKVFPADTRMLLDGSEPDGSRGGR